MLSSLIKQSLRSSFHQTPKFRFSIQDGDYYRKNFEDSLLRDNVLQKIVKIKTEEGKVPTEIEIYGVPLKPLSDGNQKIKSSLKSLFTKTSESPLFIQVDPTRYLYYERKVTRKANIPSIKQEEVQKLLHEDPIHPFTWEEAIVSPDILAQYIIKESKKHEGEDDKPDTSINPEILIDYVQKMGVSHEKADERVHTIVKVVNERILDNQPIDYYELNNVLFYSLVGGNKIILGGMPKIFKRLVFGNSLSLSNLQEIFKNCCETLHKYKKQKSSLSLSDIIPVVYPEVFHAAEVLYMTVFLKEIAKNTKKNFRAFVGIDFVEPIADHWKSSDIEGVNFSDIIGIPERLEGETADELIEKQAILDILLDENVWGLSYLHNKFPYLEEKERGEDKIDSLKKKFRDNYRKYSEQKEKIVHQG